MIIIPSYLLYIVLILIVIIFILSIIKLYISIRKLDRDTLRYEYNQREQQIQQELQSLAPNSHHTAV